jgi:hypothetical protein
MSFEEIKKTNAWTSHVSREAHAFGGLETLFALSPMSGFPNPMMSVMIPMTGNPHCVRTRRDDPVAFDPNPVSATPFPITIHPHVIRTGLRRQLALGHRRCGRRRLVHNHFLLLARRFDDDRRSFRLRRWRRVFVNHRSVGMIRATGTEQADGAHGARQNESCSFHAAIKLRAGRIARECSPKLRCGFCLPRAFSREG